MSPGRFLAESPYPSALLCPAIKTMRSFRGGDGDGGDGDGGGSGGAAGVPHTPCRKKRITMPTRRARVLESKGTEISAWLLRSTLFFLTCPRNSGSRNAARSSASTAAQEWRKSSEATSTSERGVAVVKLSSSEGSPIFVAPDVSSNKGASSA